MIYYQGMKQKCDLLIVGAGVSGLSAAVTAARRNLDVILIEKEDYLGGTIVAAQPQMICGLYANSENKPKKLLNGGVVKEIHDKLTDKEIVRIGKVYGLKFQIDELINIYKSLLKNKKKLQIIYNNEALAIAKKNNGITSVNDIQAKAVIDCSGEGDILKLAQVYQRNEIPVQLSAYTFKINGLVDCDQSINIKVPYYINQAVADNKLPQYLRNSTFKVIDKKSGYCRFNIVKNKTNKKNIFEDLNKVHSYLSKKIACFKSSYTELLSKNITDREGLRLKGQYILTSQDVLTGHKFSDGVVKNSWPIEHWGKNGCEYNYLAKGDYYQIPKRCLEARSINNLYASGRCISVSQQALGSTRVIGSCIGLGEAAAQLAIKKIDENIIS